MDLGGHAIRAGHGEATSWLESEFAVASRFRSSAALRAEGPLRLPSAPPRELLEKREHPKLAQSVEERGLPDLAGDCVIPE